MSAPLRAAVERLRAVRDDLNTMLATARQPHVSKAYMVLVLDGYMKRLDASLADHPEPWEPTLHALTGWLTARHAVETEPVRRAEQDCILAWLYSQAARPAQGTTLAPLLVINESKLSVAKELGSMSGERYEGLAWPTGQLALCDVLVELDAQRRRQFPLLTRDALEQAVREALTDDVLIAAIAATGMFERHRPVWQIAPLRDRLVTALSESPKLAPVVAAPAVKP